MKRIVDILFANFSLSNRQRCSTFFATLNACFDDEHQLKTEKLFWRKNWDWGRLEKVKQIFLLRFISCFSQKRSDFIWKKQKILIFSSRQKIQFCPVLQRVKSYKCFEKSIGEFRFNSGHFPLDIVSTSWNLGMLIMDFMCIRVIALVLLFPLKIQIRQSFFDVKISFEICHVCQRHKVESFLLNFTDFKVLTWFCEPFKSGFPLWCKLDHTTWYVSAAFCAVAKITQLILFGDTLWPKCIKMHWRG